METENKVTSIKDEISFDDLMKADIRICEIISVEKIENKDRLYKLEVNTGFDKRVIVSAIAHQFTPEQLLNKKFPFVLNLPVRRLAKIDSHGMIVLSAVEDEGAEKYNTIGDQEAKTGSIVF